MGKITQVKMTEAQRKRNGLLENLFIIILAFYPLRHITWGLDLWDTGYSYANFQYMGTEHMDPMWLFSTYLANVAGNLLMKLPGAGTLQGMNLYTGLMVSILALGGYFFCTRKLKISGWAAFLGEMTAISLCWCPTAVLYNYLTYVFFFVSSVLLFLGLTKEKRACLFLAGVFLGMNVLVRFSNLPQAAMIVAVWAYDIILWLEARKASAKQGQGKQELVKQESGKQESAKQGQGKQEPAKQELVKQAPAKHGGALEKADRFWPRLLWHTLWCFLGYAAALALLFVIIQIRYGMGEYVQGVMRLFDMTESATDYKATAMIRKMLNMYVIDFYWVVRMAVIVAGGMAMFAAEGWLEEKLKKIRMGKQQGETAHERRGALESVLHTGIRIGWILVCIAMIIWLYARGFCTTYYYSYDAITYPGPSFLLLTMGIAVIRIFHRGTPREEKLIGGMMILIILLTSIGSNNGLFPSLNNLFLAAPYVLWEVWKFVRYVGDRRITGGLVLSSFPAKGVVVAVLCVCLFQFGRFGMEFVFAEATGVQDISATVENNAVLRNIRMDPRKAEWMTELSAYVEEEQLQGKEVILYGWIPALSYYLQMPSAFNPWSDLDSYGRDVMEGELVKLDGLISEKGMEKPVIILENSYALCEERGFEVLEDEGVSEKEREKIAKDGKWQMLLEFMEEHDYMQTFRNEKFAVYR